MSKQPNVDYEHFEQLQCQNFKCSLYKSYFINIYTIADFALQYMVIYIVFCAF